MKKTKSLPIVKMIQNGLNNFAKTLHIKPNLLYIILGLLAVIFISLGLGTRKEGFTVDVDPTNKLTKVVDNLNSAINSINGWNNGNEKVTFIENVNIAFSNVMNFYVNQYGEEIKKYDKNNDNKVYKLIVSSNLKTDNSGKFLDNTGNVLPLFLDNDGSRWPEGAGYSLINVMLAVS